jgi:membrane-bound ClpP family serine protease
MPSQAIEFAYIGPIAAPSPHRVLLRRFACAALAGFVMLCVATSTALADPLSIRTEPPDADKRAAFNTHWNLYLEGEFDKGAAERVQSALAQIGDAGADVFLDSPGGNLAAGIQVGTLLRARSLL